MKQVMSNRFNAQTGGLNLSRFHNDSAFLGQDVYLPLARAAVMSNVLKIINEHVPNVMSRFSLSKSVFFWIQIVAFLNVI